MAKETTTIDKDLYEGLQQARKKKPRYFALIAKGAEVVGLIVQKKAINDGAAQKAKSECKGNLVIQGICQGEGVDLKFEVVGAAPSISPKKIKDFIAEQTDLTLKPYWSGVEKLTAVEEDETQPAAEAPAPEPEQPTPAPEQPTPSAAKAEPAPAQPEPAPPAVDAKGLQVRLKKLLERNKELVGKNPDLREKLQPFTKPAVDLAMKGSADAPEALDKLEKALNLAESGGPESARPKQQEWQKEHARIEPRFLEVLQGNPPEASKIRAVMAYATEQAELGGYDKGLAALKRLEPLLDAAVGGAGPGQLDPERLQRAETQLEAATAAKGTPEERAALAAALKRQNDALQSALDLADDAEKASTKLAGSAADLAGSLEDESGEEETGEEDSAEARVALAAALKRQNDALQSALDLADEAEKASAKLDRAAADLAGSLEEESSEEETGEEDSAEARVALTAALKRQNDALQSALDLADEAEKASAKLDRAAAELAGSLEEETGEEESEPALQP